jgi:uncharacterized protein (TIGR03435 family)
MSIAYDVPAGQIQGGPDWFRTETTQYDVDGKAADPSTAAEAELKSMLQQLVAESFKLQFHREARDVTGWALVVDKNGSKLRNPRDGEEDPVIRTGSSAATATIEATRTSMTTLAKLWKPVFNVLEGQIKVILGANPEPVKALRGKRRIRKTVAGWRVCYDTDCCKRVLFRRGSFASCGI